ncbi:Piso0_002101 [Millerozyma farinosa CBS 7064]|uniref:Piso0_002101 protein n=1 Tax=Pichia sorbitophila (strain ATCC MYA-4447 / BCRC 22081 / CBS 7064 / NBRC 10061 / NRRL Y-12695) TaxID=559304 RepID=G8YBP6_PICSO|nr:Piso0_002101 [Millerozyma farinosa CBS 7064]
MTSTPSKATLNDSSFEIKIISWSEYEHKTPILLQDVNGPCPLIALINTLLLKNELIVRNHILNNSESDLELKDTSENVKGFKAYLEKQYELTGSVSLNDLISRLGDLLIVFLDAKAHDNDLESNVDHLLEKLPLLHTGLSVNPNIVDGTFPDDDLAKVFFKIFNLDLRHGWCLDDSESATKAWQEETAGNESEYRSLLSLLRQLKTFDTLQDFLLAEPNHGDQNYEGHEYKQDILKKWLTINQTQLTGAGLSLLNMSMEPTDVIVFFRNNHFSTLYKRNDREFYTLTTDLSFNKSMKSVNRIVWQSLVSISGKDDLFFTGDFFPVLEDEPVATNDEDYLLIKELQENEDAEIAKRMQEAYNKPNQRREVSSSKRPDSSGSSKDRNKSVDAKAASSKKEKKKSNCIVM